MPRDLHVLHVEDDQADALALLARILESSAAVFTVRFTLVGDLEEALSALRAESFDLILLDLSLPESVGLDLVSRVRNVTQCPMIVLLGDSQEDLAQRSLETGAQDYLMKGRIDSDRVLQSLRHVVEKSQLRSEFEEVLRKEMQVKDHFLSHLSHELRTPLAVVNQFLSLLLDGLGGDLTPKQVEFLQIALRNTDQLQGMISDLLEVTRADAGKLPVRVRAISVSTLIRETVQDLRARADGRGLTLEAKLSSGLPKILADPSRVLQILVNLIDNAIKFTPAPGEIVVSAGCEDDDFVQINVEDTGSGISSEGTRRIFDRLYQEDPSLDEGRKGLGLGLHICKELVTCQGGKIWVHSTEGVGSQFSFTLPLATTQGSSSTPKTSSSQLHGAAREMGSRIQGLISESGPGASSPDQEQQSLNEKSS